MKNPLKKLMNAGVTETVNAVANVVDKFVATPEEKEKVRKD